MDFVTVARVAKIAALLAFVLPWVTVSCSGQPVATATGLDLALGQITLHNPMTGALEHHAGSPNIWLLLCILAVILGVVLGFRRQGREAVWAMLATSIAGVTLTLLGSVSVHSSPQHQNGGNFGQQFGDAALAMMRIENRYGYYITLLALGLAASACVISLIQGNAIVGGNAGTKRPDNPGLDDDLAFWDGMPDKNDPDWLKEYLIRFPNGRFRELAQTKLDRQGNI